MFAAHCDVCEFYVIVVQSVRSLDEYFQNHTFLSNN